MKQRFEFKQWLIAGLILAATAAQAKTPADQVKSLASLPQSSQLDQAAAKGLGDFAYLTAGNKHPQVTLAANATAKDTGAPIGIYNVGLTSLQSYTGQSAASLLPPLTQVVYPITGDGRVTSSETFFYNGSQWQLIAIGAPNWIVTVTTLIQTLSQSLGLPTGNFFVVKIPALNGEFVGYYDSNGLLNLAAEQNLPSLNLTQGTPVPATQVFLALVPLAQAVDAGSME